MAFSISAIPPVELATREVLWNVGGWPNVVTMYALFLLSLVVAASGIWQRVILWREGKPDPTRLSRLPQRITLLLRFGVGQQKTNRKLWPAVFHTLIFWGFLVLVFTTTMVFLYHDLGLRFFFEGSYYLFVTVISDLFGFGLLVGLFIAALRRYVAKPDLLHSTKLDSWMLSVLGLLIVQGFLLEALRIGATADPWAAFSPVGAATARLISFLSAGTLPADNSATRILHYGIWWFHTLTVFLFIALLPYSKFMHLVTSPLNLFFSNLSRPKGALSYPGDIEQLLEQAASSETGEFSIGVSTLKDLSWKQRLDLDACTSCGRCQEVCPAYNSKKPLSPKWLILDLRDHMLGLQARGAAGTEPDGQLTAGVVSRVLHLLKQLDRYLLSKLFLSVVRPNSDTSQPLFRAANPLVQSGSAKAIARSAEEKLGGGVVDEEVLWSCTTCRACMEVCPVGIEHVDLITDIRRSLTLVEGTLPNEAQQSLRAIETRGNPFGPAESRMDWAAGLAVPVLKPGDTVDVLYWVGCVSAYDRRKQSIVRAMVQILNSARVSWGVLGNRERCTGDPARRLGEENLFQSAAKSNLELLRSVSFKRIVANCPHCFNTLKNEYPVVDSAVNGGSSDSSAAAPPTSPSPVIHHTVFIQELLKEKRLTLTRSLNRSETVFHDPCYLGRYNDHYEEPREVLVQLGGKAREVPESREQAMCCGAGGGHFWMDRKIGERVNTLRVEQLAHSGASTIATACPFCLQMLEDGIKLTDREAQLKVRDLAELVAEAL